MVRALCLLLVLSLGAYAADPPPSPHPGQPSQAAREASDQDKAAKLMADLSQRGADGERKAQEIDKKNRPTLKNGAAGKPNYAQMVKEYTAAIEAADAKAAALEASNAEEDKGLIAWLMKANLEDIRVIPLPPMGGEGEQRQREIRNQISTENEQIAASKGIFLPALRKRLQSGEQVGLIENDRVILRRWKADPDFGGEKR